MIRESSHNRPTNDYDMFMKMPPEERGLDKLDTEDQLGFIRKVYGILLTQLSITAILTAGAYLNDGFRFWLLSHPGLLLFTAITCLVLSCCMFCIPPLTRSVPLNYILLTVFTVCESLLVAYICVTVRNPQIVLTAAVMTAGVVFALTLYAITTSTDFTTMGALGFLLGMIFIMMGLFSWLFGPTMHMMYCALGVLLFGFYLIMDTQLIIGSGKYALDRDDYILGAMILYLDIINIFLYILQFLTESKSSQ